MRIPTPMLIDKLKAPIRRNWWGAANPIDAAKAEKLMREAAVQLEWFLNRTIELENEKREVK